MEENDGDGEAARPDFSRDDVEEALMGLSSKSEEALFDALVKMRRLILAGGENGKVLENYILASPKCIELVTAWQAGPRARTAIPLLLLMTEIFRHPTGLKSSSDGTGSKSEEHRRTLAVQLRLDKFALLIVQTKLSDVYSHLSSGLRSRENAALRLMASIVTRGRLVAKEVASKFDFGLDALSKLARKPPKKAASSKDMLRMPTRVAFIEFALAFLQAGDASLLRWILQKRVLFAGALHGLANDSEDMVIRVLRAMKRKVLHGSLPAGIQVALFGDVALSQLAKITAWDNDSEAADVAQEILTSICTDPAHGTCPVDSSWEAVQKRSGQHGGGAGRLLRLMLRLRATEVDRHRELLLAIANARPVLAAAYLDSFPYSLEPRASSSWFSSMLLVSSLVRIANTPDPFCSTPHQKAAPPSKDSLVLQSALRRIWPQSLPRAAFHRGLGQENQLVKHFCLKLLVEALSALERLLQFIKATNEVSEGQWRTEWLNLHTYVQDQAKALLPDCQALHSQFSLKSDTPVGNKRKKQVGTEGNKRRKLEEVEANPRTMQEDADEQISDDDIRLALTELWGEEAMSAADETTNSVLHAKFLDALLLYQRTLPLSLRDINFDAFKHAVDLEALTCAQQESLVRLLLASSEEANLSIHRNVKVLMKFFSHAKTYHVREQVRDLLYRALEDTGAFENNVHEAAIWIQSLPGWSQNSDETVHSFLSDIVLNVGKNMYKYLDQQHTLMNEGDIQGDRYEFGPFVICALDSYLRLAHPDAKGLTIPQRSAISIYLASVLQTLLLFQAFPRTLAIVITSMLLLEDRDFGGCEWNAFRSVLSHAALILDKVLPAQWLVPLQETSPNVLDKLLDVCRNDESTPVWAKISALGSSLYCVPRADLVVNFHGLLSVHKELFKGDFGTIAFILGAYPELVAEAVSGSPTTLSEAVTDEGGKNYLGQLLRQCSFSTLFRAACTQDGRLLVNPPMTDLLADLVTQLNARGLVIASRLLLSRTIQNGNSKQVDSCFILLEKLVASSERVDESTAKRLVRDVVTYPGLLDWFLSGENQVTSMDWCSATTDFESMKQSIHSSVVLQTADSRIIRLLETFMSLRGSDPGMRRFTRDCCRPYIEKAVASYLAEKNSGVVVPSASLLAISVLSGYAEKDTLIALVLALADKTLSQAAGSDWFYLATLALNNVQEGSTIDSEDRLLDIYRAVFQLGGAFTSDISLYCLLRAMQVMGVHTAVSFLAHCLQNVNKLKAQVVHLLVQANDALLSEFGRLLSSGMGEQGVTISEDELMLLLPTVEFLLQRQENQVVAKVYSALIVKRLKQWDLYISSWVESGASNAEDCYQHCMLSGVISVLQLCLNSSPLSIQKKKRLFLSLLPKATKLLDPCVGGINESEPADLSRVITTIVGKASVLYLVLLHGSQDDDVTTELLDYVSAAISTLSSFYSQAKPEKYLFLEEQLLKFIGDAIHKIICTSTTSSKTFKLILKLAKTILRFRFGEIVPVVALQRVLVTVLRSSLEVQNLGADIMELLISHSKFIPLLLARRQLVSTGGKATISSLPSVLSLLRSPKDWDEAAETCDEQETQRLWLVKLLRVFSALEARNGKDVQTSKKLHSLLLAAYGATLGAVDRELFSLMNEIEGAEGTGFAQMDFLWGNAALEKRKDIAETDGDELMEETREETRKRRFKEDLAMDPRKCGRTVLHFPASRDLWSPSSSFEGLEDGASELSCGADANSYDPAYILPFALHALSTGCLEPEEFVRSGMLGIAFSTMSSPCEKLRKGGYELLSQFTKALEDSSFKGKLQISTLLSYIRNAITEPWQRIPSVISVFAAEASCVLMHPDDALYIPVNRCISRSPSIDLEAIPLFQALFSSGSLEQAWMFKLLVAGLSSSADAFIYRRQFVPEILMNFCTSSMADPLARKWVLQVLKRATAISSFRKSLVHNNGLGLWLASVASNHEEDAQAALEVLNFDRKHSFEDFTKAAVMLQCQSAQFS